jgi:hypothetical protein
MTSSNLVDCSGETIGSSEGLLSDTFQSGAGPVGQPSPDTPPPPSGLPPRRRPDVGGGGGGDHCQPSSACKTPRRGGVFVTRPKS